jgi:hypothetical protein
MYPAVEIDGLGLNTSEASDKTLAAVKPLGNNRMVILRLIDVMNQFMQRYSDQNGEPVFPGGSYFDPEGQGDDRIELGNKERSIEIVDSYSMSITLCLSALIFTKEIKAEMQSEKNLANLEKLEHAASIRLTAAMAGLIRSFAVYVFDPKDAAGKSLVDTIARTGMPNKEARRQLLRSTELGQVRIGLRDALADTEIAELLNDDSKLFECGWSWGIVENAPIVMAQGSTTGQRQGVAQAAPYLYFTMVALDGTVDLFSDRTRAMGLLDQEQQKLARELQLRWDLTQLYWATIASMGFGKWALEDMPWKTTDGEESEYYTLQVASVVIEDFARRRAPDVELERLAQVLEELAVRGRVIRRATKADPAIALHQPGVRVSLGGSENAGQPMAWQISDFSPLLLKKSVRLAGLARNPGLRARMLGLSDQVWDHLRLRRMKDPEFNGLWDQPKNVFPDVTEFEKPTWYITERIIEGLVAAAKVVQSPVLRSGAVAELASDLLSEAEHIYDVNLLGGSVGSEAELLQVALNRARSVIYERPGTAAAIAIEILQSLTRVDLDHGVEIDEEEDGAA